MATKQEIIDLLNDNPKDFESFDYGVEGIVAQYLPPKGDNDGVWCLWLKGAKGKGTRLFTPEQVLLYATALSDSKTMRLIKIIHELNPERTDNRTNNLRKIGM